MRFFKVRALFIAVLLLFAFLPSVSAEGAKVLLGMYYSNKSIWTSEDTSLRQYLYEQSIYPIFEKNKAVVITDSQYLNKLKDLGYFGFTHVTKLDIVETYKNDGFDYVILIDVEPVRRAGGAWFEDSAHVKIVDMKTNSYIFAGKRYCVNPDGGMSSIFRKLGKDIGNIIDVRVFKNKN